MAARRRVDRQAHVVPAPTQPAAPSRARRAHETAQPPWHAPLPVVPALHPEPPGLAGGTWAYALVALAAVLLVLGGSSLAVAVAEVRRAPA